MLHLGPFWPKGVHFGPFRPANRTLAIPDFYLVGISAPKKIFSPAPLNSL